MEPVFDSEESSSGCESGWTLYLQHYDDNFSRKKASFSHQYNDDDDDGDDDDDDMSMVSDASSGPPHFQEHHQEHDDQDAYFNNNDNENGVFCHATLTFGTRKRRKILKQESFQDSPLVSLDDTASSPFFNFFNNKDLKVCKKEASMEDDDSFGYSQGHSTTCFEIV